ncbi:MAG TPA: Crp/Fnr family transcriptional regulator [Caulobacteraceae bacterium]
MLSRGLAPVALDKGALLYEPGDDVDLIYFPHNAVISLMTLMQSGEAIESATVGREGAVGLSASVYPRQSLSRAIVQVAGSASRIPAAQLHQACKQSERLRFLVDRHAEALFAHAIQSVACNALHSVEARFCRWLLCCHDRIDSDRVSLTQEFLADMLGVQRTTVTVVARTLQAAGLIRYSRGVVDILDRAGLEAITCECYGAVRRNYERLLSQPFGRNS